MKTRTALALDTSSSVTFVAVRSASGQVFQSISKDAASHNEQLSELVVKTLDAAKTSASDLKQLIIGEGPGSFTGLRIGFSFMKGLASSINCPVASVSSMSAAAYEFLKSGYLCAALSDARRGQVFCQFVWLAADGALTTSGPATIIDGDQVWQRGQAIAQSNSLSTELIAVGVGENLEFLGNVAFVTPQNLGQSLLHLADAAEREGTQNTKFEVVNLANLEPNYVRAVAAKTIVERLGV